MTPITESERKRTKFLLLTAADALEKGQDPLSLNFLQEHQISFNEAEMFRQALAYTVRYWVADNMAEG
jgi:hypothetical protein